MLSCLIIGDATHGVADSCILNASKVNFELVQVQSGSCGDTIQYGRFYVC